jgi:hypothetical protein
MPGIGKLKQQKAQEAQEAQTRLNKVVCAFMFFFASLRLCVSGFKGR